eukprot:4220198-Pyramimonas_sp.AAC.1
MQRSSALGFCKRLLREAKLSPLVSVLVHEGAWLRVLRDAPGLCYGLAAAQSSAARVRASSEHRKALSVKSPEWRQWVRARSVNGAAA